MPEKNWEKLTFLDFSFTSVDLGNSLMVINLVNSVENVGSHGKKRERSCFPKKEGKPGDDFLMVLHNCPTGKCISYFK